MWKNSLTYKLTTKTHNKLRIIYIYDLPEEIAEDILNRIHYLTNNICKVILRTNRSGRYQRLGALALRL